MSYWTDRNLQQQQILGTNLNFMFNSSNSVKNILIYINLYVENCFRLVFQLDRTSDYVRTGNKAD